MKKTIVLSASQMRLLLLIGRGFNFHPMVESTLDQVRTAYPEGIEIGCEETFSLEIPTNKIGRFFNTLSMAEHHDAFKKDEYFEDITALKIDLKKLLENTASQQYIFKVVALLGKPVLSPELIKALTGKGVYLVQIDTLEDVQKFILLHKTENGYIEFEFLMITAGAEPAFVSDIFDVLNGISEEPVGVYQFGGTAYPELEEVVDVIAVDETSIDWRDLHIHLILEK